MQVKTTAKLNNLRMSPQKVRLIVDLIRGLSVEEALTQLQFSSKNAALPVKKLLKSAIANAKHNHNLKIETLKIDSIRVDEGKTLYRWMPRAMGRATPLRKRNSHIILVLVGDQEQKEETKNEEKKVKAKKETGVKKTKTIVKERKTEKKDTKTKKTKILKENNK